MAAMKNCFICRDDVFEIYRNALYCDNLLWTFKAQISSIFMVAFYIMASFVLFILRDSLHNKMRKLLFVFTFVIDFCH